MKAPDYHQITTTKYACPQVKSAVADYQDWVEWNGGECPLNYWEVAEYEWKQRNGYCSGPQREINPVSLRWEHKNLPTDIVAYRVLKWKDKQYACPPVKSPVTEELQDQAAPTDNDTWNGLLATNARLRDEVAKLEKRLAELEWVPFSQRSPTMEDADFNEVVEVTNGRATCLRPWNDALSGEATHWRPFGFKKPDAFEEWWSKQKTLPADPKDLARLVFNAGRVAK